jgi:hypothetical protein
MWEHSLYAATTNVRVGRRIMLKLAAMASAGLVFIPRASAQSSKAPPKPENVLSPDAALERLMNGNARYVQGVSKSHDFSHEREPLSTGQNPFAILALLPNIVLTPHVVTFLSAASQAILPAMRLSQASSTLCKYSTRRSSWCSVTTRAAPLTRPQNRSRRASRFPAICPPLLLRLARL